MVLSCRRSRGLFALNFQFPFSTISRQLAYPSRERDRVLDKILPMQALMPYAPPPEGDKILHHCLLFFQNHIPITIGSNMKQDLVLVLGSWFLIHLSILLSTVNCQLFYRSKIMPYLNTQQRLIDQTDNIIYVFLMDHFNCGMHVAQWK